MCQKLSRPDYSSLEKTSLFCSELQKFALPGPLVRLRGRILGRPLGVCMLFGPPGLGEQLDQVGDVVPCPLLLLQTRRLSVVLNKEE